MVSQLAVRFDRLTPPGNAVAGEPSLSYQRDLGAGEPSLSYQRDLGGEEPSLSHQRDLGAPRSVSDHRQSTEAVSRSACPCQV